MDMPLEGLHTEAGPGVLEAAILVDESLNSADKATLFKTFSKVMFQKKGLIANFMAKWSADYPGQSDISIYRFKMKRANPSSLLQKMNYLRDCYILLVVYKLTCEIFSYDRPNRKFL